MRLEIKADNKVVGTWPIEKNEIIIGSSSKSDIVVKLPEISRQHLKLTIVEGKFFVEDLGSTNGTYSGDEKLTNGKKAELTTFFPVRMAMNVIISLVQDESDSTNAHIAAPTPAAEKTTFQKTATKTTVIPAKDLDLKLEQAKVSKKKKKEVPKQGPVEVTQDNNQKFIAIGLLVVICLGVWYFLQQGEKPVKAPEPEEDMDILIPETKNK